MKIRSGFVSNSSSSSFIIGSNDEKCDETIIKNFEEIFTADSYASDLINAIKNQLENEFDYGEIDTKTWHNIDEVKGHIRNDYWEDISEEEIEGESLIYKDMFEDWKYVHEITFADGGDGGSRITAAMRASFPHNFKNENIEIKLIN